MRRIECRDEWRFSVNNIQFLEFGHFSRISSDFQYILPFRCWMHSHIMWHIMPVGVSIVAMCHEMPSISTLFFYFSFDSLCVFSSLGCPVATPTSSAYSIISASPFVLFKCASVNDGRKTVVPKSTKSQPKMTWNAMINTDWQIQ